MPTINYSAALPPDIYTQNSAGAVNLGNYINTLRSDISFLIKQLFANSEQGFAYDPNNLTTLYQDAAGTIPVTAAGQPVGLMLDKSGRNNHAYQTVSASRPILQRNATTGAYYLAFDGFDDFLVTNSIDFTMTDKVSLFAGLRKLSDANVTVVVELSSTWINSNGTFVVHAPSSATTQNIYSGSRGTVTASATQANIVSGLPAPISLCLAAKHDISGSISTLKVNGVLAPASTADKGTGNFGNYPLYIGRRGGTSLPFNGHLYSLIGIGRLTTNIETIALEKAIAKQVGVAI
ncbi:hypothetical protein [Acinetobacter sp. ANC 4641]|uniref:hypothetical protein n=1 Tax=Acinetobacter sp. ANC 4641 TaxID=2529847 RepID=UPI00103BFEFB|nr:hypothetical protein [Acinetobacter sp. ANC 4641]TCB11437.1 hypothetical protein E0H78_07330 [Acinetobacter sp. ANC 4641]